MDLTELIKDTWYRFLPYDDKPNHNWYMKAANNEYLNGGLVRAAIFVNNDPKSGAYFHKGSGNFSSNYQ